MILPDLRPEMKKGNAFTRTAPCLRTDQPPRRIGSAPTHPQSDKGTTSAPCLRTHTQQMTYHAMRLPGAKFGIADGRSSSIPSAALPFRAVCRVCPKGANAFRASLFLAKQAEAPIQPRPPKQCNRNRLGRENSRHSNRHAPRNTMERKVRSKIR